MSVAVVFSGQGAQYSGMGKDLYEAYPVCRDIFDKAEEIAGFPLKSVCFEPDNKQTLDNTKYCQPCVFTHSAAAAALLTQAGLKGAFTAGLSLGEYTALMYAGALDFDNTLRVLCNRGAYMAEASAMVDGVMSAVMGLEEEAAREACKHASHGSEIVSVSNLNTLGQVVISGARSAVERAEGLLKKIGPIRTLRLPVSGPYHTVYMDPAAKKLETYLRGVSFGDMSIPVVSNVDGNVIKNTISIMPTLVKQVSTSVKWADCVRKLAALGADTFVEAGPGRTLSAFIKKILPEARIFNVDNAESFEKTIKGLGL